MPVLRYAYRGRQLTVTELAELAGCSRSCMHRRLELGDVECAVAMGAAGRRGVRRRHLLGAPTPPAKRRTVASAAPAIPPAPRSDVPPVFSGMRPGQYHEDSEDRAIARALRGRRP